MKKLAILISNKGTGTNLQAIIDGVSSGKIKAKIVAVVSDTKEALGLQRAKKYRLAIKIVPRKEELLAVLQKLNPDYICLAGWKQIILDEVIDHFSNRILNLHPGLIPDDNNLDGTLGLWNRGQLTDKAIKNFIDSKTPYAGSSIHFLTKEFDFGPVLGRCFEKIKKGDTVDSLYTRLKKKENKLYADILAKLCKDEDLTVLVVDGGGRGATLVDKYAQSKKVKKILAVPGNDLMKAKIFPHLKTTSVEEILEICKKEKVDLVDVAQDNAVAVGLADELMKKGVKVFGPTKLAGQIEWDKAWAREFMEKYQIPKPKFQIFNSEKEGINFIKKQKEAAWFVKASGLAEGKGAIPAANTTEAIAAIKQMSKFGSAGETYLLEEWLQGEEFSAFALSDGENFQIVGYAQDHKRVYDGDQGPNTGGMGCVSNPLIISNFKFQISNIFEKVISGLRRENRPYQGVLYLGGMVVKNKVYVIEFNARWGDPEAQVLIPAIKNDFIDIAEAIIYGKLKNSKIDVDKKIRIAVAACSKGYPIDYSKVLGKKVLGIEKAIGKGVKIYGAGIKKQGKNWVVNGGRVLYVMGEGREKVYSAMRLISIEGDNLHYRKDI